MTKQMNVFKLSADETLDEIPTVDELRAYYRSEGGLYDVVVGPKDKVEAAYKEHPEMREAVEQMLVVLDATFPYIEIELRKLRANNVDLKIARSAVDAIVGLTIATIIRMTAGDTMKYADEFVAHLSVLEASMPTLLAKFATEDFAVEHMAKTGCTRAESDEAHAEYVMQEISKREDAQVFKDPLTKLIKALGGDPRGLGKINLRH